MEKRRKKPGPPKRNGREPMRSFRCDDRRWNRWRRISKRINRPVAKMIRDAVDLIYPV